MKGYTQIRGFRISQGKTEADSSESESACKGSAKVLIFSAELCAREGGCRETDRCNHFRDLPRVMSYSPDGEKM